MAATICPIILWVYPATIWDSRIKSPVFCRLKYKPKIILVQLPRFEPEPTPSQGDMLPITPQRG